jgi:MerR family transcriptional regulator, light-induced transcriptional regulator
LFAEYVGWAQVMLEARHISRDDLAANLRLLASVIEERLPHDPSVREAIDRGLDALERTGEPAAFVTPSSRHGQLAEAYLQALLRGDRQAAAKLVRNAFSSGTSIREIYLDVFQPVQYEIGRLWQLNRIGVAEEHFCTAATQSIMAQFYPELFAKPKRGRTLVMACLGGELHEIGARMVADLFELEGWNTWYYGANTPASSLVDEICSRQPDVVGISVTMTFHLAALRDFIRRMRNNAACSSARVIVGGYPFRIAPELAREIGADAVALDAAAALEEAERLVVRS